MGVEQRQAPASFAAEWIDPLLLAPQCEGERPWERAFRNDVQATARAGELLVWQLVAAYDGYSGERLLSTVDAALTCGDAAEPGICGSATLETENRCGTPDATGQHAELTRLAPTFAAAFDQD
ncbi:hypothetical protein ACFXPA_14140 [Amycolatopsis sp. NPDC059090]|uniref:hypothetical protein n=1 Tax=unclassified Amycolatopsis TaxID=2618356 RepID=UPI00366F937D